MADIRLGTCLDREKKSFFFFFLNVGVENVRVEAHGTIFLQRTVFFSNGKEELTPFPFTQLL